MLVITRVADGKALKVPGATVTRLTREELLMGDERPHNPSEPTSYISQETPVEVHIGADGVLSIRNKKQPFLLCRGGELGTHNGDLTNVQPADRVCFCPQRVEERDRATFSFRVETEEEDVPPTVVKRTKRLTLPIMQDQQGESLIWDDDEVLGSTSSEWRTKTRKLPTASWGSGGRTKCGICGITGHNRRTCPRRM